MKKPRYVSEQDNGDSLVGNAAVGQSDETTSLFDEFVTEEILSEYSERKMACVLGKLKDKSGEAVVILEKMPFNSADISSILHQNTAALNTMDNDVYKNYYLYPSTKCNGR